MAKNWFTMKHHGWGWVPISIEGWAVTAALIGYIIYSANGLDKSAPIPEIFWTKLIVAIVIFLAIALTKGPVPRWRWDK